MSVKAELIAKLKDKGMVVNDFIKTFQDDSFYKTNTVHVGKFSIVEDVADTTITFTHVERLEDVYVVIAEEEIQAINGSLYAVSTTHRMLTLAMGLRIPIK